MDHRLPLPAPRGGTLAAWIRSRWDALARRRRSSWAEDLADAPCPQAPQRARVEAVLAEIELLLGYLDGLEEDRLGACFAGCDPGGTGPGPALAAGIPVTPPTRDRAYFLARLASIARTVHGPGAALYDPSRITEVAPRPPAEDQGPWLDDLAFLFWARYFLAAAVFPASIETIRAGRTLRLPRAQARRGEAAVRPRRAEMRGLLLVARPGRHFGLC